VRSSALACSVQTFPQARVVCTGSGTDASVRIMLVGEQGQTPLLTLARSLTFPKNPFEVGQVFRLLSCGSAILVTCPPAWSARSVDRRL
jgi:hypothetical protein